MLARDDTAPGQNLRKQFVQRAINPRVDSRILVLCSHDVDMDVPIAGMPEAGDGEAVLLLKGRSKVDEVDDVTAWNDDILIQFS